MNKIKDSVTKKRNFRVRKLLLDTDKMFGALYDARTSTLIGSSVFSNMQVKYHVANVADVENAQHYFFRLQIFFFLFIMQKLN